MGLMASPFQGNHGETSGTSRKWMENMMELGAIFHAYSKMI
jgi:hypothetical protein